MKYKFYYNAVAGNNNDGYMAKYVDENESEFDFVVIPGTSTSVSDGTSIRLSTNTAALYYLPYINTVYAPSAFFEWNEDTSFFDPMSVLSLSNSYGKSQYAQQKFSTTNKALAYPIKFNGMMAMNHYLQYLNNKTSPDYIQYWTDRSYRGDLREARFSSIVDESLKKEVFNYGISNNIRNIEEQLDMSWDEIAEQSYDVAHYQNLKFAKLVGVRYPITSNENIDFDARISLSFSKTSKQYAIRGPEFKTIYNSPSLSSYNGDLYYQYVAQDKNRIGKAVNAWQCSNATSGLYSIPPSSSYNLESIYNQELPSSLLFADEVFYVEGSESIDYVHLIPVFNENDEDEVYFTPIRIGYESSTRFPPRSENLFLSQLGKIRLYKDKEKNKWILNFSADTISFNGYYYNSAVGHFECSGDRDPWANPNEESFNENGLVLKYIDGKGVENPNAYLRIYPRRFSSYRSGCILIPNLLGDARFSVSYWSDSTGRNIKPKYPLYNDDFQKVKTYVCADSGSYTIPV